MDTGMEKVAFSYKHGGWCCLPHI